MKLTKLEKYWILYDVGNSAFVLLVTTIMPIYFNYLAGSAGLSDVDYLAYWGYAASIATLIVALSGPLLGTLADNKDYKKPIFLASLVVGTVGYAASLVFYDAMLTDVTEDSRMDLVSSQGYAWGYIGSCVPFAVCLVLVLGADGLGISMELAMNLSFAVTAIWWAVCTIPLLKHYKQLHYVAERHTAGDTFRRLWDTLRHVKQEKNIFLFLLAFFLYIDGVYTIIDMATAYGSALGLGSKDLLLALLVTQLVAFPFAILFGRLSMKVKNSQLITVCIAAYLGIGIFAIFLRHPWQFWTLAVLVGMFQGGIQALSRSYFAKIVPAEKSGEYFGLMDICGKGAAFLGTTLVAAVSQATGSMNLGVAVISVLFLAGLLVFRKAAALNQET